MAGCGAISGVTQEFAGCSVPLNEKAEPPLNGDVKRDSGTANQLKINGEAIILDIDNFVMAHARQNFPAC
jgi:hypothetical protein